MRRVSRDFLGIAEECWTRRIARYISSGRHRPRLRSDAIDRGYVRTPALYDEKSHIVQFFPEKSRNRIVACARWDFSKKTKQRRSG